MNCLKANPAAHGRRRTHWVKRRRKALSGHVLQFKPTHSSRIAHHRKPACGLLVPPGNYIFLSSVGVVQEKYKELLVMVAEPYTVVRRSANV
jgi:hypothetical protein